MTEHKPNPTQQERILNLLREKGNQGVYVYEFMAPRPMGLGVAQYGARLLELRRKGYEIINTQPGHFILREEGQMQML